MLNPCCCISPPYWDVYIRVIDLLLAVGYVWGVVKSIFDSGFRLELSGKDSSLAHSLDCLYHHLRGLPSVQHLESPGRQPKNRFFLVGFLLFIYQIWVVYAYLTSCGVVLLLDSPTVQLNYCLNCSDGDDEIEERENMLIQYLHIMGLYFSCTHYYYYQCLLTPTEVPCQKLAIKNSAAECLSVGRLSNDSMKLITVYPSHKSTTLSTQRHQSMHSTRRLGQTTKPQWTEQSS
ncbi:hypothetical protein Ocin01_15830 [Orchesella cincta]|uniref:Uncharacterized protein n=1 Tax=Orchesella cincta TaxID=48709 RepID=A0A1D2MD06_ORCCI|nr:hypothetical protein Ocin01_15830 [Orchesella cincta]